MKRPIFFAASACALAIVIGVTAGCREGHVGPTEGYKQMSELDSVDWNAFRANPQRTGYAPEADVQAVPIEQWRYEDINTTSYGAAKSSPAVAGDTVYVGSDESIFYAIDRLDGTVRWQSEIEGTSNGIHGSAAIGPNGLVYIGAYDGGVYAFDRESGERQWDYMLGFQIGSSPVYVPSHGRVYTSHERDKNGGGYVTGLDARDGDEIWVRSIRAHAHSSVAIDVTRNKLFVGDNLAILHAWNLETGKREWQHHLPQPGENQSDIKSTPMVVEDKGLVIFGAWSSQVHALRVKDGFEEWSVDVDAWVMGSAAYAPGLETVYVGSLGPTNALHAIDVNTGEELWRFETGGSVMSSPAVDGDESTVVVGSADGNLYAIDAETGEQTWKHEIGSPVTGSPALVGDWIYVTAARGDLVALTTEAP
ncbi:MAG: PQQ-binding-like beta-propeller repeat protein [Myxococcota bacterium]